MSSPVWMFFSVTADNSAIAVCKTCSARIPRGGSFNTTNLIFHLKGLHHGEGVLEEYEGAVAAATSAKTKTWSIAVSIQQASVHLKSDVYCNI